MTLLIFRCAAISHNTLPKIQMHQEILYTLFKVCCFKMHSYYIHCHHLFWLYMLNTFYVVNRLITSLLSNMNLTEFTSFGFFFSFSAQWGMSWIPCVPVFRPFFSSPTSKGFHLFRHNANTLTAHNTGNHMMEIQKC